MKAIDKVLRAVAKSAEREAFEGAQLVVSRVIFCQPPVPQKLKEKRK